MKQQASRRRQVGRGDGSATPALDSDPVAEAAFVRDMALVSSKAHAPLRVKKQTYRTALARARLAGKLAARVHHSQRFYKRADLLDWARKQYPELVEKLPSYSAKMLPAIVGTSNQTMGDVLSESRAVVWNPDDVNALRADHLRLSEELAVERQEKATLKAEQEKNESVIEAFRAKDERRRERSSQAGKKGGRGRAL